MAPVTNMRYGGTGPVCGSTGWYLVILGQYSLVLFGIKWYWVKIGLLCLYILKKLMVTSTDRPTHQPTNRQGEYRAICLFRKLGNRKKAEICKNRCHNLLCQVNVKIIPSTDIKDKKIQHQFRSLKKRVTRGQGLYSVPVKVKNYNKETA